MTVCVCVCVGYPNFRYQLLGLLFFHVLMNLCLPQIIIMKLYTFKLVFFLFETKTSSIKY